MAQPFVEPCSRGVIAAEPCPRELGREISPERRRMVLAVCVLASSMAFIDGSALTVALPKLRADQRITGQRDAVRVTTKELIPAEIVLGRSCGPRKS